MSFQFKHSGKCLSAVNQVNSSLLYQDDCKDDDAQKFTTEQVGNFYFIKSIGGLCLDLRDYKREDGALPQLMECTGNAAQKFFFYPAVDARGEEIELLSFQKEPAGLKAKMFEKRLQELGWKYEILNRPWKGISTKIAAYRDKLRQTDQNKIVILTDGDGAPIDRYPDNFLRDYLRISQPQGGAKNRIVFSAEEECCVLPMQQARPGDFFDKTGRPRMAVYEPSGENTGSSPWIDAMRLIKINEGVDNQLMLDNLNSSSFVGRAGDILIMLDKLNAGEKEDDQALFSEYFLSFPELTQLDYQNILFSDGRYRGRGSWADDLLGGLGINYYDEHISPRDRIELLTGNKHYSNILDQMRKDNLKKFPAARCGEIIGLKPHVDHFIYYDKEANKNKHMNPKDGSVYTLFYRGYNFDGTLDNSIRAALIGLPKGRAALIGLPKGPGHAQTFPLMIWAHEFIGDLAYGHFSARVRDLQANHIVAAPALPGDKISMRGVSFEPQVGSNGDEIYDADAFDLLAMHDCLNQLNDIKQVAQGDTTDLVPSGFSKRDNPFFGKFSERCEKYDDNQRPYCKRILPAVYAGYSRGALVAAIAAAKLGMALAEKEKVKIGISGLALFSPIGPWISRPEMVAQAVASFDAIPGKTPSPPFIYSALHLKTSPKFLHPLNYKRLVKEYVLKFAHRDTAYIAPYVRMALSFGGHDGGTLAMIAHARDEQSDFAMHDAIWKEVQSWDGNKLESLCGGSPPTKRSFRYSPAPLEGGGDPHYNAGGAGSEGGPFNSLLKKPLEYDEHFTDPQTVSDALLLAKEQMYKSFTQDTKFTATTIPHLSGYVFFKAWITQLAQVNEFVGKTIEIKSHANQKYVSVLVGSPNSLLAAEVSLKEKAERFDVIDAGLGYVALRSRTNKNYVTVSTQSNPHEIRAQTQSIGENEKFRFVSAGRGLYGIQAKANNRYLTAWISEPNAPLVASVDWLQAWEQFEIAAETGR